MKNVSGKEVLKKYFLGLTVVFCFIKCLLPRKFSALLKFLRLAFFLKIPGVTEKLDQNLDFNFSRYLQRVTFKLCNLVHTNIIKSLANFLTSRITLTGLE